MRETAGPGDAARLSGEACAAGARAVVVLGGDGTVNETMQPMVGGVTPLAVWPGGTANVLAAEQPLPTDVERVASMVAAGRTRRVSVGRAGERYFLLMAGVGIDAALVRSVSPRTKRLLGQGAYFVAGACLLARWHPARFTVEVGGRRYPATFAVVANAASYGGGFRIAPHAGLERDRLALCLFDWTARRRFLAHLPAALAGRRVDAPGVTYLDARRATAWGDDTVWVQVDGEALGPLPMSFECVPAALSLIVP